MDDFAENRALSEPKSIARRRVRIGTDTPKAITPSQAGMMFEKYSFKGPISFMAKRLWTNNQH